MRNLLLIAIAAVVFCAALVAEDQLVITGSTTVLPIAQFCAEEYMMEHEDADITVRGGGSGVGIAALLDGQCDIANASRAIKEDEIKVAKAKGIEPKDHVVALDAIAVIVNPDLDIDNLDLDELKEIYTGKIKNWKEVGGPDEEIVVLSRDVSSGTFEVFKERVLEGEPVVESGLKLASNQAIATTVTSSPTAIGYIGLGYLSSKVKAVEIGGVEATIKNALSDEYPIIRKLHMYTNGEPKGMTKAFIDYVVGEKGQAIVEELGYVPVK